MALHYLSYSLIFIGRKVRLKKCYVICPRSCTYEYNSDSNFMLEVLTTMLYNTTHSYPLGASLLLCPLTLTTTYQAKTSLWQIPKTESIGRLGVNQNWTVWLSLKLCKMDTTPLSEIMAQIKAKKSLAAYGPQTMQHWSGSLKRNTPANSKAPDFYI